MVEAILCDRKTKTRRVLKPQPFKNVEHKSTKETTHKLVTREWLSLKGSQNDTPISWVKFCPYGQVGDMLWVKEAHWAYGEWEPIGATKTGKQKRRFVRHTNKPVVFEKPVGVEKRT